MNTEIDINQYTPEQIKKALSDFEKTIAYRKQYRLANLEKLHAYDKAYRQAHPELERAKYNRRKDDPDFKEKRRIKNAQTYQRRKARLAVLKLEEQATGLGKLD